MFQERLSNLREAGRVLLSRWGGDVVNVLTESEGSAVRAIDLIVSSFMSFKDDALYHGHEVYFWKRAQIFIYDLYLAFGGSRWGAFRDISHLTAFADYKLPQVLRALGILSYHPALAEKVDSQKNLESGSEEEIEIRAMTIRAVGALKEGFRNEGILVVSPQVDNWLWQLGQQMPFRKKPYHRCRTIYY
jgi:hypothetical protein